MYNLKWFVVSMWLISALAVSFGFEISTHGFQNVDGSTYCSLLVRYLLLLHPFGLISVKKPTVNQFYVVNAQISPNIDMTRSLPWAKAILIDFLILKHV